MRGMARRRNCRVASPIISTNSGLSATAGSPEFISARAHSAPRPLTRRFQNASLSKQAALTPLPYIDKMPGDRRGCCHRRRHQVGAALKSLAALEIAVRGRGAALFRRQLVGVHGEAHRAARLAPFKTGLD